MSMATELGKVVIYDEVLPTIKQHNPLITMPCKITYKLKSLHFHYHNAYGYLIWQVGDLT